LKSATILQKQHIILLFLLISVLLCPDMLVAYIHTETVTKNPSYTHKTNEMH